MIPWNNKRESDRESTESTLSLISLFFFIFCFRSLSKCIRWWNSDAELILSLSEGVTNHFFVMKSNNSSVHMYTGLTGYYIYVSSPAFLTQFFAARGSPVLQRIYNATMHLLWGAIVFQNKKWNEARGILVVFSLFGDVDGLFFYYFFRQISLQIRFEKDANKTKMQLLRVQTIN